MSTPKAARVCDRSSWLGLGLGLGLGVGLGLELGFGLATQTAACSLRSGEGRLALALTLTLTLTQNRMESGLNPHALPSDELLYEQQDLRRSFGRNTPVCR